MIATLGLVCGCSAAVGLAIALLQIAALAFHAQRRRRRRSARPPISILKPLAGSDDGLAENLECFAALDYPEYELLLGVKHIDDPAYPVALALARRHPTRVRIVVQRRKHGLNPKVSQLIGLAQAARHPWLTISDSNVRVRAGYLHDIADHLGDDTGIVTHVVAGAGERTLGAAMDNMHLTATIGPGVLAAKLIARQDVVVGKSMTLHRDDVARIGGFAAFKDILAEDYYIGRAILGIGKRIVFGKERVESIAETKSVGQFIDRYCRWSIMHRHAVGRLVYAGELLLCPLSLALLAVALDARLWLPMAAVGLAKIAIDLALVGASRPMHVAAAVGKDILVAYMLAYGFVANTIVWRGHKRRVGAGTRLQALDAGAMAIDTAHNPISTSGAHT